MRLGVVVALVVAAPTAGAAPKVSPQTRAIAAVIDEQFAGFRDTKRAQAIYSDNAMVAMTGGTSTPQVNKLDHADGKWTIFGPAAVGKHKVRDLRVTVAADGASAWASFIVKVSVDGLARSGSVDYRATQLFEKSTGGWKVRAAAWSVGVTNAAIAKAAKAGTFTTLETVFSHDLGERDVLAAAKALWTSGLDGTATTRADLIAIGPAPGEVAFGGKKVAAKHKREWLDKLSVTGAIWAVTVGSTASATANIDLQRGGATIPARMFAVLEKTPAGVWSPVLVHVAVAPPGT